MQVYHSVLTKYAPKRTHFSAEGMDARTQLAALDNNHNAGRSQAKTQTDEARFKMQYSRLKDAFVAKPIYDEDYAFVNKMLDSAIKLARREIHLPAVLKKPVTNIARREPEKKEDVVSRLQTRMKKN